MALAKQVIEKEGWQTDAKQLLDRWQRTINECEGRYAAGLDDFTNDLTLRELLQNIFDSDTEQLLTGARAMVAELDKEFRAVTVELREAIFDAAHATKDPDRLFFYFRVPREPGEQLVGDLIRMRFIHSAEELGITPADAT